MVDFTIIVLDGAWGASVSLTLDILETAAFLARRSGAAKPRWRIVSPAGGAVTLGNGLTLATAKLPTRSKSDRSVWVVPGLGTASVALVRERVKQPDAIAAARAIAGHAKRGGFVAASCSAVFLLQAAGVLAGKTVTTSWWLAPHLQRRDGDVKQVDASRILIADGALVTAGAALAHTDLMLHLLRKTSGAKLAETVSRILLIDGRAAQSPYVLPNMLAGGDAFIGQLTANVEAALPNIPRIRDLAKEHGMSERTLARHVFAATGLSPLGLVQNIRLSRARALLEQSRLPVVDVAAAVGYADATALLRLMKRVLGVTPRQLRVGVYGEA